MLQQVIDQRRHSLGQLEVGRVLPHRSRRMVGPFVFFDHMGPVQWAAGLPREADIRPHRRAAQAIGQLSAAHNPVQPVCFHTGARYHTRGMPSPAPALPEGPAAIHTNNGAALG